MAKKPKEEVEEATNTEVPVEETPTKVKPSMTEAALEARYQTHLEKIKRGGK